MGARANKRFWSFVLGFLTLIALGIFGVFGAQYYELTQQQTECDELLFAGQSIDSTEC